MLPAVRDDLRPALACSWAPGVPLRSALLCPRRATLLSLLPTRDDVTARDFRLSRIDLPMRRLSVLLVPAVGLRVADLCEEEIAGVLLVIEPPMREVRVEEPPTLEVRAELAAGCLAPVGVEGLRVPIEVLIRDLDVPSPDLERLLELTAGCLAPVEADGLSIRIELLAPDCEPGAGLSIRIELPMRDVLPELIRLDVLGVDRLTDEDTDGVLVLIERPMLDLVLVVGRLDDEETDGLRVVIELPIRALLPGLGRMLELLLTEVEPVELLLTEVLDEGLR